MSYNFVFETIDVGMKATISKYGISINDVAFNSFGAFNKVNIGVDNENKAIAIVKANESRGGKEFSLTSVGRWKRCNCKKLIRYISKDFGIDMTKTYRAKCEIENEMLILNCIELAR